MDGKSQEWREGAHDLLVALAKENKYLVSDMVILFLDSAGYGLKDYSPLGGVFKRAAKAGIIKRIEQPKASKQSLWYSLIHQPVPRISEIKAVPDLEKGKLINLSNFGAADGEYRIIDIAGSQTGNNVGMLLQREVVNHE